MKKILNISGKTNNTLQHAHEIGCQGLYLERCRFLTTELGGGVWYLLFSHHQAIRNLRENYFVNFLVNPGLIFYDEPIGLTLLSVQVNHREIE